MVLISILPICCFYSDLFPVDSGSHVPSLRHQSSWAPLPVASLRAVDASAPFSSDVFSSDPSLADDLAAAAVRNPAAPLAHIAGRSDVPFVGIDPWWRGSSALLSFRLFLPILLLLFVSLCFHLCCSLCYSFYFFSKSSCQSSSSLGYARAYSSSAGPSTFQPFSWRCPAEVSCKSLSPGSSASF